MSQEIERSERISLRKIFISFIKIGMFTFGGGYAMIPFIENEVVRRNQWVTQSEFNDVLVITQSLPGPISLNTAAFIGYKNRGYIGAATAVLGIVLPSFLIILLVAIFFSTIRENAVVAAAFKAMRPVVVALILHPAISLMRGMHPLMIALMILSVVLLVVLHLSPVYLIGVAIIVSLFWTRELKRKIDNPQS